MSIKTKWDSLTMAVGLWLIGGRETEDMVFWKSEWRIACFERTKAAEERDKIQKNFDAMQEDNKILRVAHGECEKQWQHKYNLLKKRHDKLKAKTRGKK